MNYYFLKFKNWNFLDTGKNEVLVIADRMLTHNDLAFDPIRSAWKNFPSEYFIKKAFDKGGKIILFYKSLEIQYVLFEIILLIRLHDTKN